MMYVTLARIAFAAGSEPHGLELLERLQVIGDERRLPRLVLHSLREQIRLHATARRTATAIDLGERLEACWVRATQAAGRSPVAYFDLIRRMGLAHLQIATHDTDGARTTLAAAGKLAAQLNHQRDLLETRILQAVAADRAIAPQTRRCARSCRSQRRTGSPASLPIPTPRRSSACARWQAGGFRRSRRPRCVPAFAARTTDGDGRATRLSDHRHPRPPRRRARPGARRSRCSPPRKRQCSGTWRRG